jgi:hypothetical protein
MKTIIARIGHLGFWLLILATFPVALWFLVVAGFRNALSDGVEVAHEMQKTT